MWNSQHMKKGQRNFNWKSTLHSKAIDHFCLIFTKKQKKTETPSILIFRAMSLPFKQQRSLGTPQTSKWLSRDARRAANSTRRTTKAAAGKEDAGAERRIILGIHTGEKKRNPKSQHLRVLTTLLSRVYSLTVLCSRVGHFAYESVRLRMDHLHFIPSGEDWF